MTRDDAAILDIMKAVRLAQRFVAGMTRDTFPADEKTQSAVVHQVLVIGEVANPSPTQHGPHRQRPKCSLRLARSGLYIRRSCRGRFEAFAMGTRSRLYRLDLL